MLCTLLIDSGLLVLLVFLVAEEGLPVSMAFLIALGTGVVGGLVVWGLTLGLGFVGTILGLIVYGVILTATLMYFLELERREAAIITGLFLGVKVAILLAMIFLSEEADSDQEFELEELEEEIQLRLQSGPKHVFLPRSSPFRVGLSQSSSLTLAV